MSRGGAEGEGQRGREDTESEAGSRLWAVSTEPNAGLELMNGEIMTWAEVGHSTNWATQAPQVGLCACVKKQILQIVNNNEIYVRGIYDKSSLKYSCIYSVNKNFS